MLSRSASISENIKQSYNHRATMQRQLIFSDAAISEN